MWRKVVMRVCYCISVGASVMVQSQIGSDSILSVSAAVKGLTIFEKEWIKLKMYFIIVLSELWC